MSRKRNKQKSTGIDFYARLVMVIALVVVSAGIITYIVSGQFRRMLSFRRFIIGILAWIGIATVIWWLKRNP